MMRNTMASTIIRPRNTRDATLAQRLWVRLVAAQARRHPVAAPEGEPPDAAAPASPAAADEPAPAEAPMPEVPAAPAAAADAGSRIAAEPAGMSIVATTPLGVFASSVKRASS